MMVSSSSRGGRGGLFCVLVGMSLLVLFLMSGPTTIYGAQSGPKPTASKATSTITSVPGSAQNQQRKAVNCEYLKNVRIPPWNRHLSSVRRECGWTSSKTATPAKAGKSAATSTPTPRTPRTPPRSGAGANSSLGPLANYGSTDRDVIPGEPASAHTAQNESFVWANGCTVVVNYNDSTGYDRNPRVASGISYSTDCGTTFTAVRPSPLSGLHGVNYGDPILVYNAKLGRWYAGAMVGGTPAGDCGGHGLGLWTSTNGINWSSGPCAHVNNAVYPEGDDRPSMWVDNNPASPYYGRMYISYNNNSSSDGDLYVAYSDPNNGNIWYQVLVYSGSGSTIVRNGQVTGSVGADGSVFIAAMAPSIGVSGSRVKRGNYMFRSTNGGVSWQRLTLSAPDFIAPGQSLCLELPEEDQPFGISQIWPFEGYGQPGVGPNGVVHYVYGEYDNASSDQSNVRYIRSTDNGNTWSPPITLNTDGSGGPQWMPSLAVTKKGAVFVSWYDRQGTGQAYTYWGSASTDNGATWQAPQQVSDITIPEPVSDSARLCFAGDYNYQSAYNDTLHLAWTDGRDVLNGQNQQDIYYDKVDVVGNVPLPTATPTPVVCTSQTTYPQPSLSSGVIEPSYGGPILTCAGTNINCNATYNLPFQFQIYNQRFSSVTVSENGVLQFGSSSSLGDNSCLPAGGQAYSILAYWDDGEFGERMRVDSGLQDCTYNGRNCGVYVSTTGSVGSRVAHFEWIACVNVETRYIGIDPNAPGKEQPADPSAILPPGGGGTEVCATVANFEVKLYESSTTSKFEIVYGSIPFGGNRDETIGVQRDGSLFTQYQCGSPLVNSQDSLTFQMQVCPPTPTNTPIPPTPKPTNTFTKTPTPTYTRTPTNTPTFTPSPTPCKLGCGYFADVPASDTYYSYIRCMNCLGYVGGYPCGGAGEPCNSCSNPYFRTNYNTSRGQFMKMVSEAAHYTDNPDPQRFQDVAPGSPFYTWVNRANIHGLIGGYTCGQRADEPCVAPANLPYFRPNESILRQQVAKVVSVAKDYADTPYRQTFTDVPTTNTFYTYIERLNIHGILGGYTCGGINPQTGTSEPCDSLGRPYFRPANQTSRGQAAKVVALAWSANCVGYTAPQPQAPQMGAGKSSGGSQAATDATQTPGTPNPTASPLIPSVSATVGIPVAVPSVPRAIPSIPVALPSVPVVLPTEQPTQIIPTQAPTQAPTQLPTQPQATQPVGVPTQPTQPPTQAPTQGTATVAPSATIQSEGTQVIRTISCVPQHTRGLFTWHVQDPE